MHSAHTLSSAWPGRREGESLPTVNSFLVGIPTRISPSEFLLLGVTAPPLAQGSHAHRVGGLDWFSIRVPRYPNARAEPVMQAWPPGPPILEGNNARAKGVAIRPLITEPSKKRLLFCGFVELPAFLLFCNSLPWALKEKSLLYSSVKVMNMVGRKAPQSESNNTGHHARY